MLLTEILDEVPDPRGYNAVHDLTDILFVALAAVLCGAVHCTEMAFFARSRLELLRQFVPLEEGAVLAASGAMLPPGADVLPIPVYERFAISSAKRES